MVALSVCAHAVWMWQTEYKAEDGVGKKGVAEISLTQASVVLLDPEHA